MSPFGLTPYPYVTNGHVHAPKDKKILSYSFFQAALCFDQLNDNSPSEDSSKSIVSIYKDACQHVSSSKVSWDQQVGR